MIGNGGHAKQVMSERGHLMGAPIVVAIGNTRARKKEATKTSSRRNQRWDTFISPYAIILCDRADIGEGSQIMAGAIIQVGAKIGKHCIVNCGAVVHHDVVIGDYVHVAPGAQVLGAAKVGEGSWIGANAVVIQTKEVPSWVTVRAGSVFPNDYTRGLHKLRPIPEL